MCRRGERMLVEYESIFMKTSVLVPEAKVVERYVHPAFPSANGMTGKIWRVVDASGKPVVTGVPETDEESQLFRWCYLDDEGRALERLGGESGVAL